MSLWFATIATQHVSGKRVKGNLPSEKKLISKAIHFLPLMAEIGFPPPKLPSSPSLVDCLYRQAPSHHPRKPWFPLQSHKRERRTVLHRRLANLTNLANSAWGGEGDLGSRLRTSIGGVILQPYTLDSLFSLPVRGGR